MDGKITLEMNAAEAMFALDAITTKATDAHRIRRFLMATNAGTDERAIADLSAEVLDRIELRLRNMLFPACEWQTMDCDRMGSVDVGAHHYCQLHADLLAGKRPMFAA